MSITSVNQAECTFYLYTITSFLLLLTFCSIYTPTYPLTHPPSPVSTFHPLKDPSTPPYTHPNKTWFMSTLSGPRIVDGMPEHFLLPSPTHPHTLCISPHNKSYTLANHTTSTSTSSSGGGGVLVLRGLTFMADSYYDYENPWHGLNAMAPFFAWMREREGKCEERPRRWVLFKRGELVRRVGKWVESLVSVGLDEDDHVELDGLKGYYDHEKVVVCFERVLVMRRGLGGMSRRRRNELFEMLRCKAWKKCTTDHDHEKELGRVIRVSLVGREKKKRGFKNETGVKEVMEGVCRGEEGGCDVSTFHLGSNMSFCSQVVAKIL